MKIELPDYLRDELEYIYGKDEREWSLGIEQIIVERDLVVFYNRAKLNNKLYKHCDHHWLVIQKTGNYSCPICGNKFTVTKQEQK